MNVIKIITPIKLPFVLKDFSDFTVSMIKYTGREKNMLTNSTSLNELKSALGIKNRDVTMYQIKKTKKVNNKLFI